MQIVRSTNGAKVFGDSFKSVCDELLIKQAFIPANSPQLNGFAERGLGVIEAAALAARIRANVLFGHVQLPKTKKLWAEAVHWACKQINFITSTSNPDTKSPYEV